MILWIEEKASSSVNNAAPGVTMVMERNPGARSSQARDRVVCMGLKDRQR